MTITIESLFGYSAAIGEAIKVAVADTINTLSIGDDVYINRILAAASLWGSQDTETFLILSIELGKEGDSPPVAESDIVIDFNESVVTETTGSPEYIDLVVT